jgi:hypothetical protein
MESNCEMCGDPNHKARDCTVKVSIRCPVCGSGTYVRSSGKLCCVNAFCDWVDEDKVMLA